MLKEEITIYKGNICTPLNDECNDFIWGKFIDESVVVGLEEFWHNQNILNFHEGQVLRQGDVTVDKEYKDSLDLHIPYQLSAPHVQNYMSALQDVLNAYLERFPFCETSRFQVKGHYLCSGILKVVDSSSGIPKGLMLCLGLSTDT